MSKMTGAEAIIKSVRRYGIDTIFGLPGGQTYHLFDAVYNEGDQLRIFNSRHEQGVAYMAYGYARSTGRVGVYTVVPGPGVLNTGSALCTAYAGNERVLCLAGQIPSHWIGKGVGFLHEIPDQLGILQRLTKWAERIETPADAPRLVNQAFREMNSGRPRPVALEMAPDIMGMQEEVELLPASPAPEPVQADPDLVEAAARLLGKAGSPLIVFGHGCVDAGAETVTGGENTAGALYNAVGRQGYHRRAPLSEPALQRRTPALGQGGRRAGRGNEAGHPATAMGTRR